MNLLIIEILGSLKKLTRPQKIIFSFLVDTTLFFFAVYISFLITSYTLSDEKVSGFFSIWFFFSILLTTSLCSYFSNINQIVLHTIDIKSLGNFILYNTLLTIGLIILIQFNFYSGSLKIIIPFFFINFFLQVLLRVLYFFLMEVLKDKVSVSKKVLIYGAGSAGQSLYQSFKDKDEYDIIAFIDDNPNLINTLIFSKKVLAQDNIKDFYKKKNIDEIWLAIPSISKENKIKILNFCNQFTDSVKIMPGIYELLKKGNINFNLEEISISDYLNRNQVSIDVSLYSNSYKDKNILVTGAGGSIGSELCNQLLLTMPNSIVSLEQSELSLYKLGNNLLEKSDETKLIMCLGSVTNKKLINEILSKYQIDIIIHAAAYKHVPLVEKNIVESFRNNILGTKYLIEEAIKSEISKFILVSSDKAVNPSSLMGITKRICELMVQTQFSERKIKSAIVRFGNVIGSSGSVIPLFQNQIQKGGPITITDTRMTRYFMSIEEASQLILLSGKMSKNSEIFLLDMGKEIKILDLAKNMIKLNGLKYKENPQAEGDIEIKEVNKRPGEKLYEELIISNKSKKSDHTKVFIADEEILEKNIVLQMVDNLETAINEQNKNKIEALISKYKDLLKYEKT